MVRLGKLSGTQSHQSTTMAGGGGGGVCDHLNI